MVCGFTQPGIQGAGPRRSFWTAWWMDRWTDTKMEWNSAPSTWRTRLLPGRRVLEGWRTETPAGCLLMLKMVGFSMEGGLWGFGFYCGSCASAHLAPDADTHMHIDEHSPAWASCTQALSTHRDDFQTPYFRAEALESRGDAHCCCFTSSIMATQGRVLQMRGGEEEPKHRDGATKNVSSSGQSSVLLQHGSSIHLWLQLQNFL